MSDGRVFDPNVYRHDGFDIGDEPIREEGGLLVHAFGWGSSVFVNLNEADARELRDALTQWLEHIERQSRTEAIGFIKRIDAERDRRREAGLLPMTWDELQSFE